MDQNHDNPIKRQRARAFKEFQERKDKLPPLTGSFTSRDGFSTLVHSKTESKLSTSRNEREKQFFKKIHNINNQSKNLKPSTPVLPNLKKDD